MGNENKPAPTIRFGPFLADLRGGELLKSGVKVKLQDQPFQVLAALLERPGAVITRDELRKRVWEADTFLDFERGLNKAVNRLREALSDSVENATFIETVPKRGYRFIAPVERNIRSLAILPLRNLSGDPSQEHWADGITDELITRVAKVINLRVISRSSVMRFKCSEKAPMQIACELGVDALVEGSIVLSDRKVRISAQLVDPFGDQHLWAESYERDLGDIITVQAQIAYAIARQIRARLTPEEHARCGRVQPVNPDAYEAYLKGRFFWNKRTDEGLEKGLQCFNRAIALDPSYAAPHAGIADSHVILGVFGVWPPREAFPKARSLAERALELDETLAEAHASLAAVRGLYDWDWAGSEIEFKRALALDPNCVLAHQWYAVLLSNLWRYDEAIAQVLEARDLDPLSLAINAFVGFIYMRAQRVDRAIEPCRKAIELEPNNPFGHWILARCLDAANLTREALIESEQAVRLSGNQLPYTAHLGYALAKAGDQGAAVKVLNELHERRNSAYVSPELFAQIYASQGETDCAFEWLDRAYGDRSPRLTGLIWEPPFHPLQSDPRFEQLVRSIGVPATLAKAQ